MSFYTGTQSEVLYSLPTAVTTTVSGTSQVIISAGAGTARCILPANFFQYAGIAKTLSIRARGTQTTSAGAPTWTQTLLFNTTPGTIGGLTVATTFPATAPTSSITGMGWDMDCDIVCQAVGNNDLTLQVNGKHSIGTIAAGTVQTAPQMNFFNNQVTTGNAETLYAIELGGTWSANTAGNSIIVKEFIVMGLN